MKRHDVVPGLTALLLACTVAAAIAQPAPAGTGAAAGVVPPLAPHPMASDPRAHAARPDTSRLLRQSPAGMDPIVLRLRRAAAEQRLGNDRGVVDWLEPLDFTSPDFPEAGRAAFMLAQAYRQLGSTRQFVDLARVVTAWDRRDVYVVWLERELAMIESDGTLFGGHASNPNDPAVVAVETALGLDFEPGLLSAASRDDEDALATLSRADTATALGRDLAGAALVRRAAHRLARGEDPVPLLEAVPADCRYASAARHLLGLTLVERGDPRGPDVLALLMDGDPTYAGRRDVRLLLAARELEAGRWEDAERNYEAADADASREREDLVRLRSASRYDSLWTAWRANGAGVDALTLDPAPLIAGARRLADASANLNQPPPTERPPVAVPAGRATAAQAAAAPSPEEWRAVTASARARDQAQEHAERARDAVEREQARLAAVRRYFSDGRVQVWHATMALEAHARQLDSLKTSLTGLDTRLRAVRDQARTRVLERARELLARCEAHTVWLGSMDWLYLQGPHCERPVRVPAGYPAADSVLQAERALTDSMRALVARLESQWPDLIARSYSQAWRPGLIDRVPVQSAEAARLLAGFDALDASIAARIVALGSQDSMLAMQAHAMRLTQSADSLDRAHHALESRVARAALDRAIASLGADREAIDYGLATSAYALSVRLSAEGTAAAGAGAEPPHALVLGAGAGADSARGAAEDEGLDDPVAAAWRAKAIPRLQAFLERHPQSVTRADIRFRLADLLLVQERQQFREGMARFVHDQEQGAPERVPLPVLSAEPALALYRAILAEDPDFTHRDAVLFNAGTLLADQGDPGSDELFRQLVEQHPDSRYTAEAYLRMGDLRFDDRRFGESVPLYQRAAASADPTLRAIALYKLGWAHFNGERFDDAAEAFRAVLDVYDSTQAGLQVDLQNEAESYLVHTLARAGGAAAFDRHFAGGGSPPYERRVLRGLGSHFRRYSLFAEAAATERLYLKRYALEPDALAAADRLIETYRRWDRAEETRAARLECAPLFAPGSAWARAQASDSLRTAGATFARSVWTAAAYEHHRKARDKNSREDWREALRLYELLLATFPNDEHNPAIELDAGEVCAKLGDNPRALAHYTTAAQTGVDSVASQAAWQRVAVADAWYESTRPPAPAASATRASQASGAGKTKGSTKGSAKASAKRASAPAPAPRGAGRDSLARLVLANADELLKRFPDHPRAADLMWRQGQLSLAHQWDERAVQDFGRLAESRPNDTRAPLAIGLKADALFRLNRYEDATNAYEQTAAAAKRAGLDSLERRANRAVPVCAYRRAEAAVAADSSAHAQHAELFEAVASRWPSYEHAGRAQYRAGLAYLAAKDRAASVRAMWVVVRSFPKSEYVKDAYLQIAKAEEARGERRNAADAYAQFADRYPNDESAGPAWLQAAELYEADGLVAKADTLRLTYVKRRPDDIETGIQVYETLARRELETVGTERPISKLLPPPPPKGKAAPQAPKASYLAEYMKRAKARPDLASKPLIAQVRFLEGEEARTPYLAARLKQPLEKSIPAKQKLLDPMVSRYRRAVDQGVPEWAHASTYRIGEALVAFGEALEHSERPADLKGEDLDAYNEVIGQQAQAFYDRGEAVWTELLKPKPQAKPAPDDRWTVLAQESLWKRLGTRFAYLPESEFPRVEAKEPEAPKPAPKVETPAATKSAKKSRRAAADGRAGGSSEARASAAGGSR